MKYKFIFILTVLFTGELLFSFSAPWILQRQTEYILPLMYSDLNKIVISDDNIILETLVRVNNNFYLEDSDKIKYEILYNSPSEIVVKYNPDNLRLNYFIINTKTNLLYFDVNEKLFLSSEISDVITRLSGKDILVDKNFKKFRDGSEVYIKNNKKHYIYYPLESSKFTSDLYFTSDLNYIESPYFGLEYSSYELIEEYKKNGKIDLGKPTYQPYVKNIHTEEKVDDVLIVTDEIYDIGGVCFRRSTHYKDGKIIKKIFNKYPENLNPENPDRKKYYDDEIQPYLYDIYQSKIDFDRNNIIIDYYYESDE